MLCIIVYNPLAVPLVYFLYSRGCGRHGLWPSWFVAVIVFYVAVMVCGHHSRSPTYTLTGNRDRNVVALVEHTRHLYFIYRKR